MMAERVIVRRLRGRATFLVALKPKQQESVPLTLLENCAALLKK